MAKIEPAVRQMIYYIPAGTSYIDLAKDLSVVNRRLYRQGMNYVVQDIQLAQSLGTTATDISQISFSTAGNSWIVHNAWVKGFSAWKQQRRDVLDLLPSIRPKWDDFKVYLDDAMEDGTTLAVQAQDGAAYQAGEWEYSKLVFDDDGTERELKMHIIGGSNLSDTNNESGIGLIQEYADSRATVHIAMPDVEAEASDTIYAKMLGTDEMSDMLVDNLEGDNDVPPYDQDDYPGGADNADCVVIQQLATINATMSLSRCPGFVAPCGLIHVNNIEIQLDGSNPPVYEGATAPTVYAVVTVAPGPYRGVLAAPMGQ